MKNIAPLLVLCLLPVLALACMTAVPVTETPPVPTATPRLVEIQHSEPVNTHLDAEMCTIVISTETNLRSCAGMGCDVVGTLAEGETVTAVCSGAWALVVRSGWFCVAAATRTGGCE